MSKNKFADHKEMNSNSSKLIEHRRKLHLQLLIRTKNLLPNKINGHTDKWTNESDDILSHDS